MSFRTQIHKKKFGKNGFHTLQGTLSHRPLNNALSLKITAAYCPLCGLQIRALYTCSVPFSEVQYALGYNEFKVGMPRSWNSEIEGILPVDYYFCSKYWEFGMRVINTNFGNKYAVNAMLRFENIFCSIQCVRFTSKIICLLLKVFASCWYRRKHHYRSFRSLSFQYCCHF